MNPEIFRTYDIRGIAATDLPDQVVLKLGKAYGTYMKDFRLKDVVVGRDVRLSSPRIRDALVKGMVSAGLNITDIGVVPTPLLYFSLFHYHKDGGMMITGSHNPIEYNGFKVCREKETIYGEEIQRLRQLIDKADFASGQGRVEEADPIPAYAEEVKSRVSIGRRLKVVMDPGNGTVGPIAEKLFSDLGCDVECIFCKPDGNFPNHLPDPTIPEYTEALIQRVIERKVDFGIGYDGDGDRIGAVDEKGNIIWGDKLLAIFAQKVLEERPGSKIIFEVKCSQGLVEFIQAKGGVPLMWKTGHSLIKAKMKEVGSPLAGEMSGHMFFGDNYYGYDDAIFASLRLLEILSQTDRKLSELAAEVPSYHSTPELRMDCPDEKKFEVVDKLTEYFKERYEVIDVDGVRILFDGGWGLVRASNTQPALVLRFEAKTEERLEEIKRTVMEKLKNFPPLAKHSG